MKKNYILHNVKCETGQSFDNHLSNLPENPFLQEYLDEWVFSLLGNDT